MTVSYDAVIRIRFCLGRDVLSRLIAWFGGRVGKGGWSHVEAILPDGDPDAGSMLGARDDWCGGTLSQRLLHRLGIKKSPDAIPPGVQIRPPFYRQFLATEVVEVPCTKAQRDAFYRLLRKQLGSRYSNRTILGFLVGHDFYDRTGWICDVLIGWCIAHQTVGVVPPIVFQWIRRMTPNTLYAVLVTARWVRLDR